MTRDSDLTPLPPIMVRGGSHSARLADLRRSITARRMLAYRLSRTESRLSREETQEQEVPVYEEQSVEKRLDEAVEKRMKDADLVKQAASGLQGRARAYAKAVARAMSELERTAERSPAQPQEATPLSRQPPPRAEADQTLQALEDAVEEHLKAPDLVELAFSSLQGRAQAFSKALRRAQNEIQTRTTGG